MSLLYPIPMQVTNTLFNTCCISSSLCGSNLQVTPKNSFKWRRNCTLEIELFNYAMFYVMRRKFMKIESYV